MICRQEAKILYARDQDCQLTRASHRASMETDLWMAFLKTIMVVLTMLLPADGIISFIQIVPAHNTEALHAGFQAATTQRTAIKSKAFNKITEINTGSNKSKRVLYL